jgi:hypothetical protein
MYRYMEIKIACLFRERLTHAAVDKYMSGNTFYSVANLDGRLGNADQCLTEDIAKFSQHLSHLYAQLLPSPSAFILHPCTAHRYSQISKPILDIVLMTAQLVWLAKNTIEAGSGNPILEASSIGICAIYFTNQVHAPSTSFHPLHSTPLHLLPPTPLHSTPPPSTHSTPLHSTSFHPLHSTPLHLLPLVKVSLHLCWRAAAAIRCAAAGQPRGGAVQN